MQSLNTLAWKQKILSLTPHLMQASIETNTPFLIDFLKWAEGRLMMSWSLHLHLLNWLKQQPQWRDQLTPVIIKELIIAALTRWSFSGLDHVDSKGILVHSRYYPEQLGLWKGEAVNSSARIVSVRGIACAGDADYYQLSSTHGLWQQVDWLQVPL